MDHTESLHPIETLNLENHSDNSCPKRMTDTTVQILRDHANQLRVANHGLSQSLADKNETIDAKNDVIERKQRKVVKLGHVIQQLEEFVEQKTRINREKQRDLNRLQKQVEKMEDRFNNFENETAELIVAVCRQIEVLSSRIHDRAVAKGSVDYYKGYVDGGGSVDRHEQNEAAYNLHEAEQNERQANRILNEHLSELFDYVGINVVPI